MSKFDYHMNLHYSQTSLIGFFVGFQFDYHMNLHYSQTGSYIRSDNVRFDYHMNLHYSQTIPARTTLFSSLTTI